MLANYGCEDASGCYYIQINTDLCAECEDRACISVCPGQVFCEEEDDFDDEVIAVSDSARNSLSTLCAGCGKNGEGERPCQEACAARALAFTW